MKVSAIARIVAATLTGALIAAWSGSALRAETPRDVLVVGQTAEPKSLDPGTVTSLNDFRIIVNLFDRLVQFKPGTLEVGPDLADRWTISDDGLTYTFHLRDGVTFHDGTPVDADAVVFSLLRMIDPNHPYHDTSPFPLAFFFKPVDSVRALDPHRVQIHLKHRFAPILSYLAHPVASIVSPAAVKKYGKAFGRHPVGSGPFRFRLWESRIRVVLDRNDNYWGGPPASKAVVFRPILDPNTRLTELIAGQIDLILEVQPDEVAVLKRMGGFRVLNEPGPHLWFIILNLKDSPLTDHRLRRAIDMAIDKKALVRQVLQGTAVTAVGPLPKAFGWAYLPPGKDDGVYDPKAAQQLIDAAGLRGTKLTFLVPQGGSGMLSPVAMATAMQSDLKRVGLDVKIETMEWNSYLARVNSGLGKGEDMAAMAWMVSDPDTLPYLTLRRKAWPKDGGFNSGYYSNPEVDRLIEAARLETDQAKRAELYRRMQAIVRRDLPWISIASWTQTTAIRDNLRGLRLEPSFELHLKDVRKVSPKGGS